jgi:hypothetical protein
MTWRSPCPAESVQRKCHRGLVGQSASRIAPCRRSEMDAQSLQIAASISPHRIAVPEGAQPTPLLALAHERCGQMATCRAARAGSTPPVAPLNWTTMALRWRGLPSDWPACGSIRRRWTEPATEIPPEDALPHLQERITPHVFTPDELDALLDTASRLRPAFQALTYRTLYSPDGDRHAYRRGMRARPSRCRVGSLRGRRHAGGFLPRHHVGADQSKPDIRLPSRPVSDRGNFTLFVKRSCNPDPY